MQKFYLFISLVMLGTSLSANDVTHQIKRPIYLHETDPELQNNPASSLETILQEFTSKGGTIIRLDDGATPYPILPGNIVFPSCSAGNKRSQTLWNMLRPYADKIKLMPPHATQYGFDPYNGKPNWLRIKPHMQNDEFILWADVDKAKKLGWDLFADFLHRKVAAPEELEMMSNFYNREYYNPDVPVGTKRIYITFTKNAHIHLYRLSQTNATLENVVLLFFPLEDLIKHPPPEWNTKAGSIKSYSELARLLEKYLDFTAIKQN